MILFLLNPNFNDKRLTPLKQAYYCPHCAMIEGILHYYPELRDSVEIVYVDFPRPRNAIIELLGEENQGCPVLLIKAQENEGAFAAQPAKVPLPFRPLADPFPDLVFQGAGGFKGADQ